MYRTSGLYLSLILAAQVLALLAGCKTGNIVDNLNFQPTIHSASYNPATRVLTVKVSDRDGDDLTVTVTEPTGWKADTSSIVVAGGSGNAVFHWTAPSVSSTETTSIAVSDGKIPQPVTKICELTFTYSPPPVISAVSYANGILTVSVTDANSADVQVSVTVPSGLAVDHATRTVTGGQGDAVFVWTADEPSVGGAGTTTISASNGLSSAPATRTAEITIAPVNVPPVIASAVFDPATLVLTVAVNDANGDDVAVTVTIPQGMAVDAPQKTVIGGSGSVVFTWAWLGAPSAETTISVSDNIAPPVTTTCLIVFLGPLPPAVDSAVWHDNGDGSGTLTVDASVTSGPDLTVSVTTFPGVSVDKTQQVFPGGGSAHAVFTYTAPVGDVAITGDVTVTAGTAFAEDTLAVPIMLVSGIAHPAITDVSYSEPILRVTVADIYNDTLVVSVTPVAGLTVDEEQQIIAGGMGTAVFIWAAQDPFAGGSGVTTISVDDGMNPVVTATQMITITSGGWATWPLEADTLYARPLTSTAVVGQQVTVMVYTGQLTHPLQFLSSVGLTVETAGAYVPGSFNIGTFGGGRTATDGYWALMSNPVIPDDNYLDLPSKIPGAPTDIGGGFQRYTFAVVPMGPSAPPATLGTGTGPILFNFQLTFSAAGTYHLGFQLDDGTYDQTYYSDASGNSYFWSVLDSSTTITVQ